MVSLEEKTNGFEGEDPTLKTRLLPLARDGERPTVVQYLAELPGYNVREERLLRPDGTFAAQYEAGKWQPYANPDEMRDYSAVTSRGQRG